MCDGSYADLFVSVGEMWDELEAFVCKKANTCDLLRKATYKEVFMKMRELKEKYGWEPDDTIMYK